MMNTVIAHLNAVIEGRMPTALKPQDCADALHVIEYANLAIGALRVLSDLGEGPDDNSKDAQARLEGFAHAKRAIDLYDLETARRIARMEPPSPNHQFPFPAASAKTEPDQAVANAVDDLV